MCTECDRLRARVAVLEDELAEWRRQALPLENELITSCYALGLTGGDARVLALLLQRAGRLVSLEDLYIAAARTHPGDLLTDARTRVSVHIYEIRRRLRAVGGLPTIKIDPGRGYYLNPPDAEVILASAQNRMLISQTMSA